MKLCIGQFQVFDDEMARFALQLGIRNVHMNTPQLPGDKVWDYGALKALCDEIASYGLRLTMVENVPLIYYDKVIFGMPGRDEQIDNYITTIRNLASLGVEILGHHFSPSFVWRSSYDTPGRGGVKVASFDEELFLLRGNEAMRERMRKKRHLLDYDVFELMRHTTAEDLFRNYAYFMKAVLPVAEECGLRLALHPDDPPLKRCNGYERFLCGLEDYRRAEALTDSPMWGANLCLGTLSELNGTETVLENIRFLGGKNKLFSVHFRDVQGTLPRFQECFLGEGNFNPAQVMRELVRCGFDGVIIEDHVGRMDYDSPYGHRARAHEIGYIKGLLEMLAYDDADRTSPGQDLWR